METEESEMPARDQLLTVHISTGDLVDSVDRMEKYRESLDHLAAYNSLPIEIGQEIRDIAKESAALESRLLAVQDKVLKLYPMY